MVGRSGARPISSLDVKHATVRRMDGSGQHAAPGILGVALFRSALIRERKRADRFDEVFALVTVSAGPELVQPVTEAAAVVMGETDLAGWMARDGVLGIIVNDIPATSDAPLRRMVAHLRRELARRLGAAAMQQVEVRSYVHRGAGIDTAVGLPDTDPLLDDLRARQARRPIQDALKRALDIAGGGLLLILTAPILLLVAALVKLTSRGPIFFEQERVGLMAKPFTMLKFRTMLVNNNPALHRQFVSEFIKSGSHAVRGLDPAPFKIKNDPRTTSIGRFLRRTSLDELPQLWNVLRGDMSLVGPRPPLRYELEQYRSWHWRRVLEAKPGMTGLWQVKGRSRTTFDEMVRLDLQYARTRSLWLDVKILLETPRAVITGKGAC